MIKNNREEIVCTPIRSVRLALDWSYSEMAELLGLRKATYQCYDDGTRETPGDVLELAQKSLCLVKQHSELIRERYKPGGEAEQEIHKKYPKGFLSGP